MSSTTLTLPAPCLRRRATSAAARAGLIDAYLWPQIGLAHQLQWKGHPRLVARGSDSSLCLLRQTRRYDSISIRSQAGGGNASPSATGRRGGADVNAPFTSIETIPGNRGRSSSEAVSHSPMEISPSPTATAAAPASKKNRGSSLASDPATTTGTPRERAIAMIRAAACLIRRRHIFVR